MCGAASSRLAVAAGRPIFRENITFLLQRGCFIRSVEWIRAVDRRFRFTICKVGVLQGLLHLLVGLLRHLGRRGVAHGLSFSLCTSPFLRKNLLAFWQLLESGRVILEPEIELKILSRMLYVLEIVHEVPDSTWLFRDL